MNRIGKWLPILVILLFVVLVDTRISLSQCTIRTTPVGFGNYDVFSNMPSDTTGTLTIGCSADVVKATVTLSPSSTSGTFNPRRMKQSGGKDSLDYNIFADAARATILGNGSGGTTDIRLKRPTGKPQPWGESISIYGRIPPGQDVSTGSYSDILTATVDW